jgi:hypothetical protein
MKNSITLLLALIIIVLACNTRDRNSILNKPGSVDPDEYVIYTDRDTTLVTKNGALLKIPKGSLSAGNDQSVTLQIKEAYSLEQMIQMGLTTTSNGEPLSSGGMIYISAKGEHNVKITTPIKVALPTSSLAKGMQLFKGVGDENDKINWTNPTPLAESPKLLVLDKGQLLFEQQCASCHKLGQRSTGPDLAHFKKRIPYDADYSPFYFHWPGSYPQAASSEDRYSRHAEPWMIYNGLTSQQGLFYEVYKCNLKNGYGLGPSSYKRADTSNEAGGEIEKIFEYIQNESDKRKLPFPEHAYLLDCADSCAKYIERIKYLDELRKVTQSKKAKLLRENGASTKESRNAQLGNPGTPSTGPSSSSSATSPAPISPRFEDLVDPEKNDAIYYQFSIESFGWYNVDVLMKEYEGSVESELLVRAVGEYREKLDMFLVIPSTKTYTKAGKKSGGTDEYVFAFKDGKIFLPQNAKAYILAITEIESNIAFVLKEFVTTTRQEIDITLQKGTKDEFNSLIGVLNQKEFRLSLSETKNAKEIRDAVKDLENLETELQNANLLKPKNCNCDCDWNSPTTTSTNPIPGVRRDSVTNTSQK